MLHRVNKTIQSSLSGLLQNQHDNHTAPEVIKQALAVDPRPAVAVSMSDRH
jgi:hypothetical protein